MQPQSSKTHSPVPAEALDISEKGGPKDGKPQTSDRRLFCQLLVFTRARAGETAKLIELLKSSKLDAVVYADVNDPEGIGLLVMSENPDTFVTELRNLLLNDQLTRLKLKPEFTMLGRTYAIGFEQDLEDWLLKRSKRIALDSATPWVVWYPLRRKPEFELLSKEEQRPILMEHGTIGRRFGEAGFASDIRLACHGIDTHDNEFVLGLVGKDLYPLSRLVQDMRKTQQTAKYIQSLGPFFVGRALWQSPIKL
ncbi:MAG: chlorite dismutase family protein [Candidatus Omnitrophica bacterium]|nr:chlorite dismutase family protein [Candidatus Omnitrophota bacterium]